MLLFYNERVSASSSEKKYLSLERAGKLVGADSVSLKMWCDHGEVGGAKKIGPDWFVPEDSLLSLGELASERRHVPIPLPVKHALLSVLLLVGAVAGFQFFNQPAVREDLGRGVEVVSQSAQTAQAFDEVGNGLGLAWRRLSDFLVTIGNNISYYLGQIGEAWGNWWQDDEQANKDALKEEIRAELKLEFEQELQAIVNQINNLGTTGGSKATFNPDTGVVLVPSTGEPGSDQAIKNQLKNMFSDEVQVEFDASGQAGVITPIYPSGPSSDRYVFILTPIKQ